MPSVISSIAVKDLMNLARLKTVLLIMQAQQKPQGALLQGHDGGANVAFSTSLESGKSTVLA